jgi:hypothetical protein
MAQWHLDELQAFLERRGWRIIAQQAGDEYSISATWVIQRSTQAEPLLIDFEGLDDMKTLPLEQSYGCHIRGHSLVGVYFGRKGHKSSSRRANWQEELSKFATQLDELEKA